MTVTAVLAQNAQVQNTDRRCFFVSGSSIPSVSNTGKLALPSLSQVQPRGFEEPWYQSTSISHQTSSAERLPALSQLQSHHNYSSVGSSPRGDSIGSAEAHHNSSDTVTSYSSSINGSYQTELKTPSPEQAQHGFRKDSVQSGLHHHSQSLPVVPYTTYDQSSGQYISMNQGPSYMDVTQSHMSNSIPSSAPPPGLAQDSNYQTSQPMQGAPHYGSSPTSYSHYGYPTGLAPLHGGGHHGGGPVGSQLVQQGHPQLPSELTDMSTRSQHMLTKLAIATSVPPSSAGGPQYSAGQPMDQTGQVAPPGMKPRVTATLWEDEGSLCFQVEANGVCVARREGENLASCCDPNTDSCFSR